MALPIPWGSERVQLISLCAALLAVRAASMLIVSQPGYTDAYYYTLVAERLALGQGLTADFVWNLLEAPGGSDVPVASHRFWMPLTTLIASAGVRLVGGITGTFGAAQLAIVAISSAIPVIAYAASRSLGGTHRAALFAALLAGLGGVFAPGWVSIDSFVPAAVAGTAFFLLYRRAAQGDVRAGALAGCAVGVLYLARVEGALFGIALLALRSRAGLAGAAVALAIGLAWQLRQVALGYPTDLLARSVLLVRYEDFFGVTPPTVEAYLAAWPGVIEAKVQALVTNAVTFCMAFLLILLPGLAVALRRQWSRPDVRAWAGLAALILVAQSVVWTLHSTRGSYFHSLAAFLPFGVALAVAGSSRWSARPVTIAAVAACAAISIFSLAQWDDSFNAPFERRAAAAAALPPGRLLAIDAAAWRWITGRVTVVTPAEGLERAACDLRRADPRVLILEAAHFSAYDRQYREAVPKAEHDGVRIFEYRSRCEVAGR